MDVSPEEGHSLELILNQTLSEISLANIPLSHKGETVEFLPCERLCGSCGHRFVAKEMKRIKRDKVHPCNFHPFACNVINVEIKGFEGNRYNASVIFFCAYRLSELQENEVVQSLTTELQNTGVTEIDQLFSNLALFSGEKQKG